MKKYQCYVSWALLLSCLFITSIASAASTLKTKTIEIAGHHIVYDSGGEGEPILLLHGLFGSKNQWHDFANILMNHHYHVVALDLPGYGKSTGYPEQDYDLKNQVALLHQFTIKLHLNHINLAGNSMGGLIAAFYADRYGAELQSLAFIGAPFGSVTSKPSPTDLLLAQGKNPFIPTSAMEFKQEMSLLFTNPPVFSQEEQTKRIHRYQEEYTKDVKIWTMVKQYQQALNQLTHINLPTLIIWGNADKVIDVSGAKPLHQKFLSQLVIFPNGSHLLFMEQPSKAANIYMNFLKQQEKIKHAT
ncbi:MAG: alpha/beta hydrolase [Gammaproteobacteria bacterium]